jgi:hypothetical protein
MQYNICMFVTRFQTDFKITDSIGQSATSLKRETTFAPPSYLCPILQKGDLTKDGRFTATRNFSFLY